MSHESKPMPAAVIYGGHFGALSVARTLGRKGIKVYCHDHDHDAIALSSRYTHPFCIGADAETLLSNIGLLGERSGAKPVLYITSDAGLSFITTYFDQLKTLASFPYENPGLVDSLLDKVKTSNLFLDREIPTPRSWRIDKADGPVAGPSLHSVVLKPLVQTDWTHSREVMRITHGQKVMRVEQRDLSGLLSKLTAFGPLMAQDYIPGGDGNLYYFVGYRDKQGQMLFSFSGRKLRTLQGGMGSETVLESDQSPDVLALGREAFEKLNIVGFAGVDIKRNADTDELFVIEVNYRFGLSDGILASAGINLPMIYFRAAMDQMLRPTRQYRYGVKWLWIEHVLPNNLKSLRAVAFGCWPFVRDVVTGRMTTNVLSIADPAPWLKVFGLRVSGFLSRTFGNA